MHLISTLPNSMIKKENDLMVNKYIRKSNRGSWTEETMQMAMNEAKTRSISSASKKYGIPIGTLHRHIKKGDSSKSLGRFKPVFSKELEREICDLAMERDILFYGLTKRSLQQLAYEVAKVNNIPHPFACEKAGKAWLDGFMKRHPQLAFRTPEPTALAPCSALNRTQVNRFYDNLWSIISHHNFLTRPDDIYNMDETGVKTSASKPPRVISVKGKKQVGVIATAEKGQLTTVICACSATCRFIPPCFMFGQRKRMNERLLDGAPNGSLAWVSDSGWITNSTFNNWLKFFIDITRPKQDRPVLLILDNHSTHQNLEALNLARQNHVIMVSIPPHTSHKLQPLDVSVYRSFKVAFEQALDTFQKNHPGRRVNQFGFCTCNSFYENAAVIEEQSNTAVTDEGDKNKDPVVAENIGLNNDNVTEIENPCDVINDPVEKNNTDEPPAGNDSEDKQKEEKELNSDDKKNEMTEDSTLETRSGVFDKSWDQPSTSHYISPIKILPSPKVTPTIKKRKARCQRSEVLTSSPFKNPIKMKIEMKGKPNLLFNRTIKGKENQNKEVRTCENKGKGKGKGVKTEKDKHIVPNIEQSSQNDVFCVLCGEPYVEPPTEDWVVVGHMNCVPTQRMMTCRHSGC
ncbi:unnamed protein product [Acanthoscelides obtectus]|uniref:HTH CENPB-type domain-containing protein n=1 Tax=Acanthoscelides obtectus TaxID=200917 RepID=A0A9P0K121_ACAOB|nr:unnamed protein product [Acanthoscelides obtectus]CAK1627428.1 Jerky protein homolog-like [Acanthoscelides obtectus]